MPFYLDIIQDELLKRTPEFSRNNLFLIQNNTDQLAYENEDHELVWSKKNQTETKDNNVDFFKTTLYFLKTVFLIMRK